MGFKSDSKKGYTNPSYVPQDYIKDYKDYRNKTTSKNTFVNNKTSFNTGQSENFNPICINREKTALFYGYGNNSNFDNNNNNNSNKLSFQQSKKNIKVINDQYL